MVWMYRKNDSWLISKQSTIFKIGRKKKPRQTQTTVDRQYKGGHRINWTDIEGSNGLDKGPRTMEVINSYPSPPNGWHQELMMMMMMMMMMMQYIYDA